MPEQGWVRCRSLQEPWAWVKCERSSRAPSTAHSPSSSQGTARPWLGTEPAGWVPKLIAKASELVAPQLVPAPGTAPRPTEGTQERIIQHFWPGKGQQSNSRADFWWKSRPESLLSPPGARQLPPRPLLPANRSRAPPQARTQALIPKGMNRSVSYFPNHTKCSRDAGRTGELTPNITCTTHHPTSPEQPCPALIQPLFWASTEKEQKKTIPNPTRILAKFFPTPGLHPTELGFGHKVNKEKPTVHKQ